MKKTNWLFLLAAFAGAILLCVGKFVLSGEEVKQISGMCFGLGGAAFALGIGNFIGSLVTAKTETEEIRRKKDIEVNDERNTRIREKVGAKINQIMIYILSAAVLALGFMGAEIWIIIMVACILLSEPVLLIAFTGYYSKRM